MAQTKKRRRKKHRGTQAGSIDTRKRKPKTRAQAKAMAAQRKSGGKGSGGNKGAGRQRKELKPPTLKGALLKAGIAAVIFLGVIIALKQKPAQAISLALFAFVVYVPISYWTEKIMYNRDQKKKAEKLLKEDK